MHLHRRRLPASLAFLAVLSCALGALALPSAALASKCGDQVLADWADNGQVDRTYALHCYQDAVDSIPADIRDYANAEEVISRALAAQANNNGGNNGGGTGSSSGGSVGTGGGSGSEPVAGAPRQHQAPFRPRAKSRIWRSASSSDRWRMSLPCTM